MDAVTEFQAPARIRSTVRLERLSKRFGAQLVVDDISLIIEPGGMLALLGPSGCGKTTTLRMIAGHEAISDGDILIRGENVSNLPPVARGSRRARSPNATFSATVMCGNSA